MATHSTNISNGTHIIGSTVQIDTLNVNKTSTHEEIMNSLPSYHTIIASGTANPEEISLVAPVSVDHVDNSMFFVDGQALSRMPAPTDPGPGYHLTADGMTLTISGFTNLSASEIHGLYTDQP